MECTREKGGKDVGKEDKTRARTTQGDGEEQIHVHVPVHVQVGQKSIHDLLLGS